MPMNRNAKSLRAEMGRLKIRAAEQTLAYNETTVAGPTWSKRSEELEEEK